MPVPDDQFLTVRQAMSMIKDALEQKKPFSLVRVGDGENIVLAQESAMTVKEVLKIDWAKLANKGQKGVTLPNLKLRDEMADAINRADLVGIPFWRDDPIRAPQHLKRPLTEETFRLLNIAPKEVCHTFVNRVFAQKSKFWKLMKGKKVVLISAWADKVKKILTRHPYDLHIPFTIEFTHYDQMDDVLATALKKQDQFDIALVSCGVNAVVLCPRIAEQTGKIALDFGKSLMFIVERKAGLEHSSDRANKKMLQ